MLTSFEKAYTASKSVTGKLHLVEGGVLDEEFEGYIFRDCDISIGSLCGSIFSNCIFDNCLFHDMHLDSVTFRNCTFKKTTIRHCTQEDLIFQDCKGEPIAFLT